MIRVLYFARLRDLVGVSSEEIAQPPATVAELIGQLRERGEAWESAFSGTVLVAVNQEIADPGTAVSDGDEVGFFPPVTGG